MNDLSMNFLASGTDLNDFYSQLEDISKSTDAMLVKSDKLAMSAITISDDDALELALMTSSGDAEFFKKSFNETLNNEKVPLIHFDPVKNAYGLFKLKFDSLRGKLDKETISELLYDSKMLMNIDGTSYVVAPCAFLTLLSRAGLGGDAMCHPSIGRVMEIFKQLVYRKPQTITLITRKNEIGGKSIIAAHSGKYAYIPQTAIREIIDAFSKKFGVIDCLEWAVTQENSYCYISFPDVAKDIAALYNMPDEAIPGVCVSTSDCGESSFKVRSLWKIKGHIFGGETYKCRHRGSVSLDDFITEVSKQIYAEYKTVPQKLNDLLKIDVPNPVAALKKVFQDISMTKAIGKKKSMELLNAISMEFSPTLKYTAYDIVMSVSTVSERLIGASRAVIERVEGAAKRAIFVDFNDNSQKIILGA